MKETLSCEKTANLSFFCRRNFRFQKTAFLEVPSLFTFQQIKALVEAYNYFYLQHFHLLISRPSKYNNLNSNWDFLTTEPDLKSLIGLGGFYLGSSFCEIKLSTSIHKCCHCWDLGYFSSLLPQLHSLS